MKLKSALLVKFKHICYLGNVQMHLADDEFARVAFLHHMKINIISFREYDQYLKVIAK